MITIIRIAGRVNRDRDVEETLNRLRLGKKYTCTLIDETPEMIGMIRKVRNFIAYGKIEKNDLAELIEKRGKSIEKGKKIDNVKTADMIIKNKSFKDSGIKPYFGLHPPRGGIDSRQHYPRGVLGDNKEGFIKLLRRML
jgi:large subunit ribosomal protein L30